MKKTITLLLSLILLLSLSVCFVSAEDETEVRKLISISHRSYRNVSMDTIASDFEIGADMISVSVVENEGEFVLETDGEAVVSLESAIKAIPDGRKLILDGCWKSREAISELVNSCEANEKVLLRTNASANEVYNSYTSCGIIDVYSGGVVFSAMSRVKKLQDFGYIQFQSKNYFNPFYQKTVTKLFDQYGVTAIAPAYDLDLSGQRQDNTTGWDELIGRGYNAIETDNIEGLVKYIREANTQREHLSVLIFETNQAIDDLSIYSQTTSNNYSKALEKAESVLGKSSSLAELQDAYSSLVFAKNNFAPADGKDTTKGAWNITVGKVIASVLCGAGLVGFEVFLIKHKKKKA